MALPTEKMAMVAHTCNPSTWELKAGDSQVKGQPWLHSKILSQKLKNRKQQLLRISKAETLVYG
jgi:hypothetical protein